MKNLVFFKARILYLILLVLLIVAVFATVVIIATDRAPTSAAWIVAPFTLAFILVPVFVDAFLIQRLAKRLENDCNVDAYLSVVAPRINQKYSSFAIEASRNQLFCAGLFYKGEFAEVVKRSKYICDVAKAQGIGLKNLNGYMISALHLMSVYAVLGNITQFSETREELKGLLAKYPNYKLLRKSMEYFDCVADFFDQAEYCQESVDLVEAIMARPDTGNLAKLEYFYLLKRIYHKYDMRDKLDATEQRIKQINGNTIYNHNPKRILINTI